MKKFCTKCGKPFDAVGREVICPACKAQAVEETKHAAVLRAKRASWTGESVPVRISGRASTVIREYAKAHDMAFAESLDALLQSTSSFKRLGIKWSTIVPYKSHRRDKATSTTETPQETAQDAQEAQQTQATKTTSKASSSKATASASKATSKASKK